jgi:hypothetical protein
MKPAILLLAAAATIGAAPARPSRPAAPEPRYEAGGFEPFWWLVVDGGILTYNSGTGEPDVRVPVPPRRPIRNGYRYVVSPDLTITVRHVRCESYGGRIFADTVFVPVTAEGGCGGRPIAPASLNATGWEIGFLNGAPFRPEHSNFSFEYDHVARGTVGCSRFSVPYTERRPFVRFGRMTVSRSDCPGSAGELGRERDRQVLDIVSGPSRISVVDGDTLVLTGRHGIARLSPD